MALYSGLPGSDGEKNIHPLSLWLLCNTFN